MIIRFDRVPWDRLRPLLDTGMLVLLAQSPGGFSAVELDVPNKPDELARAVYARYAPMGPGFDPTNAERAVLWQLCQLQQVMPVDQDSHVPMHDATAVIPRLDAP